jgi:protoporphyrinogen oxidase
MPLKIAILGGGISGVALARLLAADGHRVVVLEKANAPAGCARAAVTASSPSTRPAATSCSRKDKPVLDWQLQRCGGEAGTVRTVRNTKIRWHDRWVPYPFENGVGHLTKEAIVDCIDGYVEAYVAASSGEPCPSQLRRLDRLAHG